MKVIYLRVTDDIHDYLARKALEDGRSLNAYIIRSLVDACPGHALRMDCGRVGCKYTKK